MTAPTPTISTARRRAPRWRALASAGLAATLAAALATTTGTAQAAPLFGDNFDDGNHNGWSSSGGSWSVVTDGSGALRQASTGADARVRAGATNWTNYRVTARVKPTAFGTGERLAGVAARAQGSGSYYYLGVRGDGAAVLGKVAAGTTTVLASAPLPVSLGTWYALSLEVNGGTLTGRVDGGNPLTATDGQYAQGQIGLLGRYAAANFDDVAVESGPAGPTPSSPVPTTPGPTPTTPAPTTPAPTTPAPTGTPTTPVTGPADGFASVNALGQNGTTGGAGGPVVTAYTSAQFLDYIARPGPYVIQVVGTITLPTGTSDGMHNVTSDKTIVGVGATATLSGGGLNIGLPVSDTISSPPPDAVHNVIIRNLHLTGATDDLLNVQMFSHHIWIDHNEFSNGDDGAVDIKRGSDFVTVSWNNFHDHDKTLLLSHDEDAGAQDLGRLRVTYHHNYFNRSDQRHPRVRFSHLTHVYNNYYYDNSYGVASTYDAGVLVEGNYFYSVNNPGRVEFSGDLGRIVERGNILVDCNHPIETRGTVTEPSTYYSYRLDAAADIPTIVPAGAGVGKLG
ncbi:pectate lyase [Micromonospora pisi]|uniref:Pectate lyase n=1 Tax=Micromonospora pisi TaxID=589240 RepID=A0A495JF04_9ACTN|nr:pectate lyase [Micromonospora pisi]RKR86952.1 pectate lyase [Micromonospora pisi]